MLDFRRLFLNIGMPILAALFSVFFVFQIISVDRNVLAQLMEYIGYGGFILGVFWPRAGLYFLIGISGYLDCIKRLLVVSGDLNWSEIVDVLKVAPLTLAGVFTGLVILRWIQGRFFSFYESLIFLLVVIFFGISIGYSYWETKDLFVSVATGTNSIVYLLLLIIIPLMIQSKQEILSLMRFMTLFFLPIALYGIVQHFFGMADFEIEYLKSGYTVNIKELYDVRPRPLSTLNSNHAFALFMAIYFILSTGYQWFSLKNNKGLFFWLWGWIIPFIYLFALLISFTRTSWVMGLMGVVLTHVFKNKKMTAIFYFTFFSVFTFIITNAKMIYDWLMALTAFIPSGDSDMEQALRLGTYSDRLISFHNLTTNPRFWSLFGNRDLIKERATGGGADVSMHDALTGLLVYYGFFGLILVLGFFVFIIYKFHMEIFLTKDPENKEIGCIFLSIILGVLVTGMFSGNQIHIFPVNLIFWLMFGVLLKVFLNRRESGSTF